MASLDQNSIQQKGLEEELIDAGNKLLKAPSSTEELLNLLDVVERLLCKVDQGPAPSMLDSLQPLVKALIGTEILKHTDIDVKVSVASCIKEITRIMAPEAPYDDEKMKEFFELSIVAFEQLSNTSGRSYLKALSIINIFAKIRVCVVMLDLELDELIVKMFERFLDIKSQADVVLLDIERIMTLIVEESEEPPFKLLSILVTSVKKENQEVSPFSWKLAHKVLTNCADKLQFYLPKVVSSMGIVYHDYADIVASICQVNVTTEIAGSEKVVSEDIVVQKVDGNSEELPRSSRKDDGDSDTRVNEKSLEDCQQRSIASMSNTQPKDIIEEAATQQPRKRRGRKPNSLRKEEEGYANSQGIGGSSSRKTPSCAKNYKKRPNLSNSVALEGLFPSEPIKESHSVVHSAKEVPNKLASQPSQNLSILEEIHSKEHQKENIESSKHTDNGLNLLSVSAGDLQRTQNEEALPKQPPLISGSSGGSRGKKKRGIGSNASPSTGDMNAKRRRATKKNETGRNGHPAVVEIYKEGISPIKTDGIYGDRETKSEFPMRQSNAMVQQQPSEGFGFGESSKVKKRRKRTSLSKEEELVGRKIKVWWPDDAQYYRGVVTGFDQESEMHKVEYTDGDEELLYLRNERWELAEDAENGEAAVLTKPGVISSSNRFFGAQTNSSSPVKTKTNQKSYTGKRTKRMPVHDEKGQKSLAPEDVKTMNMETDVGGYKVKAAHAPVLTAIFAKYGDIASQCVFTSVAVRTSLLEVVCDIVKRVQSNPIAAIIPELDTMETAVHDAEVAKLEVSWLRQYLDKIRGVKVGQSSLQLKDMMTNTVLVAKAAKRELAEKQVELAEAQKKVKEAESCVKALMLVAKKFNEDIKVCEAKESTWRKPLNDLVMP